MNYDRAYLGHMASETVVSHNVMVSGQFPKHMGWSDEAYRDADDVLGNGSDQIYVTGDLTQANFDALVRHADYPKLADYLRAANPGTKWVTVGEKGYAVESINAPSNATDIAVRLSSRRSDVTPATGCANLGGAWREPSGTNVPSYLTTPKCGRFFINADSGNDYGHEGLRPDVDVSAGRQPLRARVRPGAPRRRQLGGRRGARDDGQRELVGHAGHARRDRQDRAHARRRPRRQRRLSPGLGRRR